MILTSSLQQSTNKMHVIPPLRYLYYSTDYYYMFQSIMTHRQEKKYQMILHNYVLCNKVVCCELDRILTLTVTHYHFLLRTRVGESC